jgi:predicted nucleotidyltransferase
MKKIVEMEFGSPVYGTSLPTSDKDYKAVFLPSAEDILLLKNQKAISQTTKTDIHAKSTADDIEWELFPLKEYFRLLLEGQTVALTMLFMPEKHIISATPEWRMIVDQKDKWIHRGVSAFAGYCRTQANKYGVKGSRVAIAREAMNFFDLKCQENKTMKLKEIWSEIETLIAGKEHASITLSHMRGNEDFQCRMLEICNRKIQEHCSVMEAYKLYKRVFDEYGQRALQAENNENVDWKACMHAIRVACEAKELLLTGHITYPRPEAGYLLQVRKGERPYKEVGERIEQGLDELEKASAISKLPAWPNAAAAEAIIYYLHGKQVIEAIK